MSIGLWRTDRALAQRLELAEATSNASFVEARARLSPASGAEWRDIAGTYAMFDGPESPITQTFGLGMFSPLSEADLEAIEDFFSDRGADTSHEVCPMSDPSHLSLLSARGYHPIELSSVLWRSLDHLAPGTATGVTVRPIEAGEEGLWAETSSAGWSSEPAVADLVRGLAEISVRGGATACFLAEHEGRPVAAGGLFLHEGVLLLAGASTVPAWRGRGAQNALLAERLRWGAAQGADLAMVVTLPGSTSQLNAERQGFRMAYTRTKWRRP
ncbi:MAG TPA: GNAT family N-acetyltransferase [Gemmatimonadales bacterium]